jgi:hypothetical protein
MWSFSATLTAFQENTSATTAAMAETTLRSVVNMCDLQNTNHSRLCWRLVSCKIRDNSKTLSAFAGSVEERRIQLSNQVTLNFRESGSPDGNLSSGKNLILLTS